MIKLEDVMKPYTQAAPYAVDVSLDYIESTLEHWAHGGRQAVELDPDFQRVHVWTEDQQKRFVEYMLRGGHAGKEIYFNCSSWMRQFDTPIYLVDGKQRLEAVRKFLRGDLEVFGHKHNEYESFGFHIGFKFYINNLATRAEMLQWYLDLNEGGTQHTKTELAKVRIMLGECI